MYFPWIAQERGSAPLSLHSHLAINPLRRMVGNKLLVVLEMDPCGVWARMKESWEGGVSAARLSLDFTNIAPSRSTLSLFTTPVTVS